MKPIVVKKTMKQTVEPTWCSHCCSSVLGGDNVYVMKAEVIGQPGHILCTAECARAAVDSIDAHGGLTPCVS
jgi:hypothetical protein